MKQTKWRAAAVGVGVSLLALLTPSPSQAAGVAESGPRVGAGVAVRDGVDFDAACLVDTNPVPPAANSVPSPAPAANSGGCSAFPLSLYDGSTEATDLSTVDLTSYVDANGEVWLKATIGVDGRIPGAGAPVFNLDTPSDAFRGIGVKVLYQNKDKQHNGDNPGSGCTRVGTGTKQRDQSGHWRDGWHYFLSFDVTHVGSEFVHSVSAGVYDPTPDGAFFFDEFGVNSNPADPFDEGGAVDDDPAHQAGADWKYSVTNATATGPSTIVIETKGRVANSDNLCVGGEHVTDYGSETPGRYAGATYTGDRLHNIKGLSTANQVVVLPVTVPLSIVCQTNIVCESDLTSVAGFVFFSDTTAGGSTNGSVTGSPAVNIVGIAYSGGAVGGSDTLGETQTCPTPTFGGTLPDNPIWSAQEAGSANGVACEIDDDTVGRGSVLTEWWETAVNHNIP